MVLKGYVKVFRGLLLLTGQWAPDPTIKRRFMGETGAERAWATSLNLSKATDEELQRLKRMTDDDLLRSSQTLDLFAVVESNRRLREALHKEEKAIKWLTGILVILTVLLVYLGIKAVGR